MPYKKALLPYINALVPCLLATVQEQENLSFVGRTHYGGFEYNMQQRSVLSYELQQLQCHFMRSVSPLSRMACSCCQLHCPCGSFETATEH